MSYNEQSSIQSSSSKERRREARSTRLVGRTAGRKLKRQAKARPASGSIVLRGVRRRQGRQESKSLAALSGLCDAGGVWNARDADGMRRSRMQGWRRLKGDGDAKRLDGKFKRRW